jgi:hypothetical protein
MKALGPFEDGSFASVASSDGKAYLAYQTDPRQPESAIRVVELAAERVIRSYPTGVGAAFPLLKPTGTPVMVAWRRADTGRIHYANPLTDTDPHDLGDVGANNEPFAWDGDWLWWQDATFQIKRANVVVGVGREVVAGQLGRGTGIARIVNGRAILRDFDRIAYGLTFPCYAAGCVALEGNTGGLVVVRESDQRVARAYGAQDCFTPRIVGWGSGVVACTYGSGSVRAVVLAANDFEDGPIVLPVPNQPPPPPPPAQEPDPPPQETGSMLTDQHKHVRNRYVAKFAVPEKATFESPDEWEDRLRRRWTIPLIQQMMFSFPNDGFCVKSADAGRPESKDAMGRVIGGVLHYYDLLTGAGTGRPTLVDDPPAHPIPGQFIHTEYGPVDLLGTAAPPPAENPPPTTPPPTTPPPTGTDLAAVHAKLDAILAKLAQPIVIGRL